MFQVRVQGSVPKNLWVFLKILLISRLFERCICMSDQGFMTITNRKEGDELLTGEKIFWKHIVRQPLKSFKPFQSFFIYLDLFQFCIYTFWRGFLCRQYFYHFQFPLQRTKLIIHFVSNYGSFKSQNIILSHFFRGTSCKVSVYCSDCGFIMTSQG